mgnify:CR=1 FL=1
MGEKEERREREREGGRERMINSSRITHTQGHIQHRYGREREEGEG